MSLVWWGSIVAGLVTTRYNWSLGPEFVAIGCTIVWCRLLSERRLALIERFLTTPLGESLPTGSVWPRSKRFEGVIRAIGYLRLRCESARNQETIDPVTEPSPVLPKTENDLWNGAIRSLLGIRGVSGATIITANDDNHLVVLGDLSRSERYRGIVERLYGDYLRGGERVSGGVRDGALTRSVFGEFTDLGFRYALLHPFRWESSPGTKRGVAWVGFSAERPPSEGSVVEFYKVVARLQESLRVFEAVAEVSHRASEAEHSDARKTEFLTHISHDIRSPLNTVRAVLSLLKEESSDRRASEIIDVALRNCDGVGDLVGDIIDFTRYKEGHLHPRVESVSVRSIVNEVIHSFDLLVREKRLKVLVEESGGDMNIEFDRRHLRRVVSNLIGNAIKYTERGAVRIELIRTGDRSTLAIEDSGVGMTNAEVARLFTPFARFGDNRIDGVGLGLTVTQALLEANGAAIEVRSTPHVGSRFTVVFGGVTAPRRGSERETVGLQRGEGAERGRIPTVLLVDDDRDSCVSLARALSGFPVETLIATTVPDGMSLFNFAAPDIVVTDLGMPLGGGERLIEYVRSSGRNTPIYCLSGYGDTTPCCTRGVRGVFRKPVDIGALWCAIEGVGTFSQPV